jgi:hypothetical protein
VLAYRSLPTECTPWFTSTINPYRCGFVSASLLPLRSNSTLVSANLTQYPSWFPFMSESCHYDVTHDFVCPSYSLYPREWHLHSSQRSFRSWSLTPREAVSIGMELDKDLPHPEHLIHSDESIRQRGLTDGCNIDGSLQRALGDREALLPSNCLDIIFSPQSRHPSSFFCAPPSFRKSWDEISFEEGGL